MNDQIDLASRELLDTTEAALRTSLTFSHPNSLFAARRVVAALRVERDQNDRLLPIVKETAERECEEPVVSLRGSMTTTSGYVSELKNWKDCGSCLSCRARAALAEGGVG